MTRIFFTKPLYSAICVAVLTTAYLTCGMVFAETTVVRPKVNHRVEPIGLESETPVFRWNLEDDVRNTSQKTYRIRVASSPELLAGDDADLWDSGTVESSEMVEIEYAGKPLSPSTKYYWTVSVKNNRDETATLEPPATFVTGLCDAADWKAQWISMTRTDKDPMPIFRKSFALDKTVKEAYMHICGLGHYELRLNGAKVGNSFIDPGWTNYKKTCLYGSYDVTQQLRSGENVFGVMLGNGMYNVPGGRYVKFTGTFGPPKLIAQLEIFYEDGSRETVTTDDTWRCALGPIVFSCVYGGEDFDATRIDADWDRPGFDDAKWQNVQTVDSPGGVLRAQEAPPITVDETLKPEKVWRLENGQYIADFGYNFSGRPRVLLRGKPGSKVTVKTGELVDRIWEGHSYTYTLTGSGKNLPLENNGDLPDETVELLLPKFTYFGFQFLRIEGAVLDSDRTDADKELPTLVSVQADFTTSSAERVGTFHCSNETINEIDKMIERSVRSNLQSVLTDCPHREKLGWLEVSHLMGPSIMSRFDVQNLYRKICRDTTESQLENGLVPDIAPEYTRFNAGFFESPEWGSACVQLPYQLFHVYGDKQIVHQQMETMERYVNYLASTRNEQGLVKAGLGDWYDWSPEKGHAGYSQHTPGELTATAMLHNNAISLHWMRYFNDIENDHKNSKNMTLARQVTDDYLKAYAHPDDGTFATGSQAAQAISLACFGLFYEEYYLDAGKQLIKSLEKTNHRPTVGEVAFPYLLNALEGVGRNDIIWDIITSTEKPGYGYMLKHCGMKTLSETWDGPGSSMNHCMFGHAQEWFMESIAGITVDYTFFKIIALNPKPVGDLTSAEGTWNSPYGKIVSSWKIKGNRIKYHFEIPIGCETAGITLLMTEANQMKTFETMDESVKYRRSREEFIQQVWSKITLNGKSLDELPDGVEIWDGNEDIIEIQITNPSGTYEFETEWKSEKFAAEHQ